MSEASAKPKSGPVAAGWEGLLDPGERIVWQGRPGGGVRFSDPLQSFFGLFFLGFSVFWVVTAATIAPSQAGPGRLFPLFGLPFVAVGFYLVAGRLLWAAYVRRRSWYTLTDRRAFIAREVFGRRSIRWFPITSDTSLELEGDAPGSIWFAEEWKRRAKGGSYRVRVGFEQLDDARGVLALIRKVQRGEA